MKGRFGLAEVAAAVLAGEAAPQELLEVLLVSTVFCEAPGDPGVMTVDTPDGPVVPVFSSPFQLARARGAVSWFSTSGMDLMVLLPDGHDLDLDPAGEHPLRLRTAALQAVVTVHAPMSFRLAYDAGDLGRTATSLAEIGATAREIEDQHRRMASTVSDCGSEDLAAATDGFLDAWSYGMKIIGADADGLGEAIGECAAVYEATDQAGATGLEAAR